jgi:DNA ligase (NAD+)
VLVEKAGEIIPQVLAVVQRGEGASPAAPPSSCPSCGATLEPREGEVALRCPNRLGCPAQRREAIEFCCGRGQMNIESIGPKLVAELVSSGLVQDVADLFDLTVEKLAPLERMGEKSARNVVESLERARREATLGRLLAALGIPLIGGVAARAIAARFQSLEALLGTAPAELREALDAIDGVGEKIAESVTAFLSDPTTRAVLAKLEARGLSPREPQATQGPLGGRKFCVTGTLSRSREQVRADIEAAGGRFVAAVGKGTDFLVAGDKTGEAKRGAAAKHGTRVIDEAQLYRMIGGEAWKE